MKKSPLKKRGFLLDTYYIILYIRGMKEIVWIIVAIGFIAVSTDVVEWLADKIEDKFK